jgi:hypothetical protein
MFCTFPGLINFFLYSIHRLCLCIFQVVFDNLLKVYASWSVKGSFPIPATKTLHKKTVHKQELRGYSDLFIWFGGPLEKSFQGPVICWSLRSLINGCYWLLQQSNQFLILFSLLCGPLENAVVLKCRHPHSLAQSSSIMSLVVNTLGSLDSPVVNTPGSQCSWSRRRPQKVDKRMVLEHTHGLFIT